MARQLEAAPTGFEEPVPEAFDVRRYCNQPATGPENSTTFSQQSNGIQNVLNDVVQCNGVDGGARQRRFFKRAARHLQAKGLARHKRGLRVRLDALDLPAPFAHGRYETPAAATNV
jgi:hypothetical protein